VHCHAFFFYAIGKIAYAKSLASLSRSAKNEQLICAMFPRYPSRASNAKGNAGARGRSKATAEQIDQQVRKLLDDAYRLARTTLLADRDKLEGIAKGLLEYENLDSSQIKETVEHGQLINPPPGGGPPSAQKMPAENQLASLGLTPREAEVLTWMAEGKSNYEIGVILSASTGTICKHVEHILAKLNVENRTTAAVVALATLANAKK
jgi:DNA-binding CsgD family transcriptional regulator